FKDCIGAIDGSLIPIIVSSNQAAAHWTRKGFTAQNAFVACPFDCTIDYVLAGWEGSAHDARVLADAIGKGFEVPKGKYYLADAGYGISSSFLTPYRGVRYHLKEQELFNLRHASARNCIKRTLRILKARYTILKSASDYGCQTSAELFTALYCLHNFIIRNGARL
ncbi:unnamed protein product, partial [Tuber aestivum]